MGSFWFQRKNQLKKFFKLFRIGVKIVSIVNNNNDNNNTKTMIANDKNYNSK